MKRRTITIILAIVLISGLVLPYWLPDPFLKYLSDVSTLITLCATVITLIIALILYNQLGLDQTILQRKSDVVFRLLNLLNERHFVVATNVGYHPMIWLTSISRYKTSHREYGNIKLLFNTQYLDYVQPILELTNDVFLPTEILPKIQALEPTAFAGMKDKTNDVEFGKVVVDSLSLIHEHQIILNHKIDPEDWGTLLRRTSSHEVITLEEFIEQWDDLIITSTQWLAKYSSYQDLNIPFFSSYGYPVAKKSWLKKIQGSLKLPTRKRINFN